MTGQYEKKEVITAWLFLTPLILIVGIFILLPVLGTFYNSLFMDVSYLPKKFVGLSNYARVLGTPDFWTSARFTILYALAAVSLEIILGTGFAVLLNESFKGRGFLRVVILIPWAIPTIVSAKTWQLIYEYHYGLMNSIVTGLGISEAPINWFGTTISSFWALVMADVWKTTPFVVIILLAGLQAIPEDLYKQARIDGAGALKRFFKITMPLLRPVIVISLIFRTVDSLRMFDLVYVLTGGGPGGNTRTLSFLGYESFANDSFGMGTTISVVTFIISFIFSLVYIKAGKFQEGM